jgi:hypothetical protein
MTVNVTMKMHPRHAAQAIRELADALYELIGLAESVAAVWERGDLAAAVSELEAGAEQARKVLAAMQLDY